MKTEQRGDSSVVLQRTVTVDGEQQFSHSTDLTDERERSRVSFPVLLDAVKETFAAQPERFPMRRCRVT